VTACSYIKTLTFDCADALVVAHFWAAALGMCIEVRDWTGFMAHGNRPVDLG
jgi:hypothetical protein